MFEQVDSRYSGMNVMNESADGLEVALAEGMIGDLFNI